jgi:hypothetical protein
LRQVWWYRWGHQRAEQIDQQLCFHQSQRTLRNRATLHNNVQHDTIATVQNSGTPVAALLTVAKKPL